MDFKASEKHYEDNYSVTFDQESYDESAINASEDINGRFIMTSYGDRAFSTLAPRSWNSLPEMLKKTTHLKAHLFNF